MFLRRRMLAAAALAACLLASATGIAGEEQAQTGAPHYFALMGRVAHPGVYETPESSPLLVELLRQAGGFQADASGHVRIVRKSRNGYDALYADSVQFRLQPGDLLIAEPAEATSPFQAAPAARTSESSVEAAFLNLIERPVVVNLRQVHSTVGDVWALLGQPPESIGSVRLLDPSASRLIACTAETPLVSGAVLVFDPSAVQAGPIPAFPSPIPVTFARAARPADHAPDAAPQIVPSGGVPTQVVQPQISPRTPAVTTAGLSADQSRAVEPEQAPAPPIDSEGKSSNIEQVGSTEPWNIPEVELLDPPGEESSLAAYDGPLKSPLRSPLKRTADVELAAAAPPPVAPAATAGDPFSVRASAASMTGIPDLTARPPSAVANPAGRKNSAGLAYAVGALIALTGTSVLWLLSRQELVARIPQQRRKFASAPRIAAGTGLDVDASARTTDRAAKASGVKSSPAATAPESAASTVDWLDLLIHDELPIEAEPVPLTLPAEFYGRPAGPRILRIDAAHRELQGPHSAASRPAVETIAAATAPTTAAQERTPTLRGPHADFASSAEPATATVSGPLSGTPGATASSKTSQPATLEKRKRVDHSHHQEFYSVLDRALSTVYGGRQS